MKRILVFVLMTMLTVTGCGDATRPQQETYIEKGVENVDNLKEAIGTAMNEIGIEEFKILSIRANIAKCQTDDDELEVRYSKGNHKNSSWRINTITRKGEDRYYYSDNKHDTVYDYETDEVIREGTPYDFSPSSSEISNDLIKTSIRSRVDSEYKETKVESISMNNDSIALVYLTWETKNSEETTKKMLRMYSDDLAANISGKYEKLTEIAVFWKVPYLSKDYKWHYTCKDGKAMMDDSME